MTPWENKVLDLETQRRDRNQTAKGFPFKLLVETAAKPPIKRHILKGIFARGETSAWVGPPGSLKSALMASACLAVASGSDWFGRRNKERCGVVYFALERADLVERRLRAEANDLNLPIAIVRDVFDLLNGPQGTHRVIATIREAEEAFGLPVGVAAFDTFAKLIAAGGGDEDKAKDQGRVFANLQRIKNATDCHIPLIGHTGKDETRGARGSNAILGDVDLMVTISGEQIKTATITKANDGPEGPLFSFQSDVRDLGTDEDGDPITVNIVEEVSLQAKSAKSSANQPKLTDFQSAMFKLLHEAGPAGLCTEEWNRRAREAGIGERRATLCNLHSALKVKGLVKKLGDIWTVDHT